MAEILPIAFQTTGANQDRRLIQEYILDLLDRIETVNWCERVGYAPTGQAPTEGGRVILAFVGDEERIRQNESDRWNELVEEGYAKEWERDEQFSREMMEKVVGEQGTELHLRQLHLASKMSVLAYEEFDDVPAPVDEYPEDEAPTPVGWWEVLHDLTVQMGYTLDDELSAYTKGIDHTLKNIAEYESPQRAEEEVDELIQELEDMRQEVTEGRDGS